MPTQPQHVLKGSILTPGGWVWGELAFDENILTINGKERVAPAPPYVLPGFIDLHVHGGGGGDVMDGLDAIRQTATLHARHGTTALLATSVTAPRAQIEHFFRSVALAEKSDWPNAARVLGAHLEGPFINPNKLGAQPNFPIAANGDLLQRWSRMASIRIVTYAPELDQSGDFLTALHTSGMRAQIGHTLCSYHQASAAIDAGCGVTHLFNAMSGMSHRGNGAAGAALARADYAEIIADLQHVEAGAILAARRAIPHLYGVTDAVSATGMPDGKYFLGTQLVSKNGNRVQLDDGTLAGSCLTMDQALRNLVSIGLPLDEAARRLSTIPADWLGLADRGRLLAGAKADIVVLDADLCLQSVFVAGRLVDLSESAT
ncbi:MAG: amidohydrolase family protein [Hyphomicrobiaceae bacterium]|nr:amidohydrolase family protein [Hyphomicrobiaceae bacterium]